MAGRPGREQIFRRLEESVDELHGQLGGLPGPSQAEDIWTSIWHQDAHNSTAIEGNTLVIHQVERLLDEGAALGNKQLAEYLEVKGYADAARWIYGQATQPAAFSGDQLVTLTEVRHVHKMAMGPSWDVSPHPSASDREAPGGFREHDIKAFPGGMRPPAWPEVRAAMVDWAKASARIPKANRPLLLLAGSHAEFERIHPFLDGNGRTGRLILNLKLVRLGYPPAIIYRRDRDRYLRALRRADKGDPGLLGELLARSVLDNLYRFVIPASSKPGSLVPLVALASGGLTEGSLRVAANRGRLKAQKGEDGIWRSTKAWVSEYRSTRHRRGS